MFGIALSVATLIAGICSGLKKNHENELAHKRGLERRANGTDITNTYFDCDGIRRDLDSHAPRIVDLQIVESRGEDQCIRDVNDNIIRNLSEERRMKKFNEARRKGGRTVVLYKTIGNCPTNENQGGDGYCYGPQFKDLTNGEIYVARRFEVRPLKKGCDVDFGYVTFYMRLDGIIVREADSVTQKRNRGKDVPSVEEVKKFIDIFNYKQKNGNGWNDCKNKINKIDSFGNIVGKNCYALYRYYCNKSVVYVDC